MIDVHQNLTVLSRLVFALNVKFHKLPHFTPDVTGQHYHPVLSDVSLPGNPGQALTGFQTILN